MHPMYSIGISLWVTVMSTKEALILAAHADDETLAFGGLIQKLKQKDWNVRVLIMSDGTFNVRGSTQSNKESCEKACELLKVDSLFFLGFTGQRFDLHAVADMANVAAYYAHGLNFNPDLIVTHTGNDINNDHRIVLDVAKILARPKKKPISLLCGEVPNCSFWNASQFPANYYVDITDELATKVAAFKLYAQEVLPYPHPWSPEALTLLAQYHGMQCGYRYAEAYQLLRGYPNLLP